MRHMILKYKEKKLVCLHIYFHFYVSIFVFSDTNILWLPSSSKWQHADVSLHVPCICSWVNPFAESGTDESWCWHLCCSCSPFYGTHFWTSTQCSDSTYLQLTHVSISVAASKCLEFPIEGTFAGSLYLSYDSHSSALKNGFIYF